MPGPLRGGAGVAPGEGIEFMAYAEMEPEKLVSGFLTVMVRNIDVDSPLNGEAEDDVVTRMHKGWADLLPTAAPASAVAGQFPNMASVPNWKNRDGVGVAALNQASRLCPEGVDMGGTARYNREGLGQSLGDYDIIVYHLTAGFHIHNGEPEDGVIPTTYSTGWDFGGTPAPVANYPVIGSYYTGAEIDALYHLPGGTSNDGEWADYFTHYGCQSFVRSSLISRHNNAYQHDGAVHDPNPASSADRWGEWTNDASLHANDVHDEWDHKRHYNYYTSFSKRKEWHIRRPNMASNLFPDPFAGGGANENVETGLIDDYHERYDDFEQQDSAADTGHHVTYGKTPSTVAGPKKPGVNTGAGAAVVNENVFQTGIVSQKGPKAYDWIGRLHIPNADPLGGDDWGQDLGEEGNLGNVGIDLSEGSTGLNRNNTFINPIEDVKIWGEHPLQVEAHPSGVSGHPNKYWPVRLIGHPTTFWNLCIRVNVWGCNDATTANVPPSGTYPGADDVKAQKKFIRDRIQIFYQPFGETEKIKFSIDYRAV